MTTDAKLLTAEEFMLLPDPPEGGKMELVNGEVVRMAPVGGEHGDVASGLGGALRSFTLRQRLGRVGVEVGYRLKRDPDVVRAPDVSFLRRERLESGRFPRGFVDGAPTLAVEVVSPGDSASDVDSKVAEYLAAGAERVWVVQPPLRTVTVHLPNGDSHTYGAGDTLTSKDAAFDIEGFALPIDEIFA